MKHYLYTLIILALFSCSKDEPEKANTLPGAFEVTAKAEGTDVILTWTDAVDADGDAVTYAVVYGDTLAKGLTARTFTIKDLPYEGEISGTVVASDGRGGKTESGFKVKTGTEPWDERYVRIDDNEFEKILVGKGYDEIVDGRISKEFAQKVTHIYINDGELITSVKGLEVYKNLEVFVLSKSKIKTLSLIENSKLNWLELTENRELTDINVFENKSIGHFMVFDSNIKNLDLSGVSELRNLYLEKNYELETLNLRNLVNLDYAMLNGNMLETVSFSDCKNIRGVVIDSTNLKFLNLGLNLNLVLVSAKGAFLESVLIAGTPSLKTLEVSSPLLKNINLSSYRELESLSIVKSNLRTIDLSNKSKLRVLNLSDNLLENVDVSEMKRLTNLYVSRNKLLSLDLNANSNLIDLFCDENKLSTICLHPDVRPTSNWKKDASATYKVCD